MTIRHLKEASEKCDQNRIVDISKMVRTKSGANTVEMDANRKMLDRINDSLMGLRRRQIALMQQHFIASQQLQTEMMEIKKEIDKLCGAVDQLSERIPKKRKIIEPREFGREPSLIRQSTAPANRASNANSDASPNNPVVRKSARKMKSSNLNDTIATPSPARGLRSREEISHKVQQSTHINQTVRMYQQLSSAKKPEQRVSVTTSSRTMMSRTETSTSILRSFHCKPCSITLRRCEERSLRKRKN